jgi:RHS repeat-associated protein
VNFDVAANLPSHVQILKSYVAMGLSSESTSTAEAVGVWQAAQPWTNLATWNSYDGSSSWSTPGGDTTGAMEDQQSIGASGDVGSNFYWDVNTSVQGWVDGSPPQVEGFLFAATAGSKAPNTLGFNTETSTTDSPYLQVYYEPRMGDYPGARYDTQRLTDRSSLGVNVGTGNLLVSNTDMNLSGVNGVNVNIGRYYNNLSSDQNSFGVGWSMGTGADTFLEVPSDENNVVDYFDGTGNAQLFISPTGTYTSPPGVDAQLTINSYSTYRASVFTLFFRHSGITETFDAPADTLDKVARLATLSDRNGNTIHYNYNSSNQLTSIVDSHGATTTISYSPAGYVSQITDPTGRLYKYTQNTSGQLTSYTDPGNNWAHYTYDSYGNLTQITTPQGNITNIVYDAGNTNAVTSVTRLVHPTDTTGPRSTYQYATASGTCPANAGWTQGTVSDPNLHVSTYCTDDLSRITQSVDGNGHSRSTSYSPDGFVSQVQTPLGMPTAFTYSSDGRDNVTQIQQGTTGGTPSPLNSALGYTDASNPYQATSVQDPQTRSVNYTYNSTGNLTQAKEPTTGDNAAMTYNPDGTVATSTDANANQTTYGYTGGDLTTVTPPMGSNLSTIHLSYDSANRVSNINTVSGSTGHQVTYSYDAFDHITQALYKNAAGTTVATIGYTYDNDGNLKTRADGAGTTSYTYDGLNRLTLEQFPNGTSNTYTYDAASNLTGIDDGHGKVTYGYDKANQLTSVTDPGASNHTSLTYNNDGQLLTTTYPSGASMVNSYNSLDQLTQVSDNYKTSSGASAHLSYAYTYTGTLQNTMTDQAGNLTTYSYDALNRLTEARTGQGSTTADYKYTLDGAGNVKQIAISGSSVTSSTSTYAYNPGNEICWSYPAAATSACGSPPPGAHSYTYDGDGNQTSNGNGLTATYNALGQTTSITSGGTTTNYTYLGEGQTALSSEGATALQNDTLGPVAQTTGTSTTNYTQSLNGTQLDERTPTATYNYLYDGIGNVVALTDSTAHLANQYAYQPYGTKTTNTGTAPNPFGFQDGYQTTSGLYHYGARYQNPTDARWTQQDPLNNISSLTQADRYAFAGNDPVNITDPTGDNVGTTLRAVACVLIFSCGTTNNGDTMRFGGYEGPFPKPITQIENEVGGDIEGLAGEAESVIPDL